MGYINDSPSVPHTAPVGMEKRMSGLGCCGVVYAPEADGGTAGSGLPFAAVPHAAYFGQDFAELAI